MNRQEAQVLYKGLHSKHVLPWIVSTRYDPLYTLLQATNAVSARTTERQRRGVCRDERARDKGHRIC